MIQTLLQKQPFAFLRQNWYSLKYCKTHRKTCLNLDFLKVAVWEAATLLKKRIHHKYFLWILWNFLRAPTLKNTSWRLLLSLSLETPNYWISLSFFIFSQCLFIDLLVHLPYVFVLLIEWLQSNKYILTVALFVLMFISE